MNIRRYICLLILISLIFQINIALADQNDVDANNIIAEPNGLLTLRHALALALINNPQLMAYSLDIRIAHAQQLHVSLRPNPELQVEVENVGGYGELSGFGGAETTIQLSQLMELAGKRDKRRKVASFDKELAALEYENKKLEVFSQTAKAFITLLKAQENLKLSNEIFNLAQQSFDAVEKRIAAGKDSPIEKNRASVAFSNVKIQHQQIINDLQFARKYLASFWAQENPKFFQAAGDLDSLEQLPQLDDLLIKLSQNPQYAQSGVNIKKSKAILDLEKANSVGDITLSAGVRRLSQSDENAVVFGFSIPLPLSNRNQYAKQQAVYNIAKAGHLQKAAWLDLQNQLNQNYQDFTNSYKQVMSLKNEVLPAATQMFDAASIAYQQGKSDFLSFLDAQRTLFDLKNQYIESLAACHIAKTNVQRLAGDEFEQLNNPESEQ